ncbi:MAG: family 20 glycosylhydrolase [Acidimicrobiales bacterium]
MTELKLFPKPRLVDESYDAGAPANVEAVVVTDRCIVDQGYRLSVLDGRVELRHSDEAGLRYGQDTLAQLRRQFTTSLPGLIISDWPDIPSRGYMLDISRDRVPTMETLGWLVEVLALCRFNQLQLYMEHTFAFADHETVWGDASAMTAAEMRDLDRLCAAKGIELVPCLNVFGHMGKWLRHDRYRDRAECPDGFELPGVGTHMHPQTLEPSQANANFALELLRELTDTVSSSKVNICCDEAMELGLGKSRNLVAKHGKATVFVDQLLRIVEPLIEEGREVMFWGDMFRLDPQPISRLPLSSATALAWQYDPPSTPTSKTSPLLATPELAELLGFPPDLHLGFESQTRQLAAAGYPFWVAPGTSSWNSLIGRWPESQANLLDAVDVGFEAGAAGMLLTDWGDTGHMQPLAVSSLPIAFAGALSWCSDQNRGVPSAAVVNRVIFGNEAAGLAEALMTIGGLSGSSSREAVNGSSLFFDLLVDPPLPVSGTTTRSEIDNFVDTLSVAEQEILDASPTCRQGAEIIAEIQAAIRLARHGVWRGGRSQHSDNLTNSELREDLAEAIDLQTAAWLGRNRPGGLAHSLALLSRTATSYEST